MAASPQRLLQQVAKVCQLGLRTAAVGLAAHLLCLLQARLATCFAAWRVR